MIRFWNQLQDFHDTDRYWDGERLTAEGDGAVVNLLATEWEDLILFL
jgi:hypothetical protein